MDARDKQRQSQPIPRTQLFFELLSVQRPTPAQCSHPQEKEAGEEAVHVTIATQRSLR